MGNKKNWQNEPVKIAPDSYWVGRRDGTQLECNIYLRVFEGKGRQYNMLIEPGPPKDLPAITYKTERVIGDLKKVNLAFISHQDPDVAFNAAHLQKINPKLQVFCSEDTWRLIRFYGLDPDRYIPVERFKTSKVKLQTGHILSFVPCSYCHFRGSIMLYGHETRVLYTGDLFGGLCSEDDDFYADESRWEGMKAFHQVYMPIQGAVHMAINNIKALDPKPLILAPQHGSIITGDQVDYFINQLDSLSVGVNLFHCVNKENYINALNDMIAEPGVVLGEDTKKDTIEAFSCDATFPSTICFARDTVSDIKIDPDSAIEMFIKRLEKRFNEKAKADVIERSAIKVLQEHNIPLPEFLLKKPHATEVVKLD